MCGKFSKVQDNMVTCSSDCSKRGISKYSFNKLIHPYFLPWDNNFSITLAIFFAIIVGTAFPTVIHCSVLLPKNFNLSGSVCILAASLT